MSQPNYHSTGVAGRRNGRGYNMRIMKRIEIQTPAFVPHGNGLTPIALCDSITVEVLGERKIALVRVGGYRIATNHTNPLYRVALALQKRTPGKTGVRILVQKNIPPGKGLHSQMGNAAGTALALNQLWNLDLSERELVSTAQTIDPAMGKILKSHFKASKKEKGGSWIIVAIPKAIVLDRSWLSQRASLGNKSAESVAIAHFPDLKKMMDTMRTIGWSKIRMAGMGPAIIGYSKQKIGIGKIPKNVRKKMDFMWIGKACNGEFKLLH